MPNPWVRYVRMLLVTAMAVTGLLAPPAVASKGPQDPAFETFDHTRNMHPMGSSLRPVPTSGPGANRFNSDLAFWGTTAYQGHYDGFRIIDVSSPGNPKEVLDYTLCAGDQGDVVVWGDILVRSWNSPAPLGATCDGQPVLPRWEGVHIFDVSDPKAPSLVGDVQTLCGSHTATGVPDLENGRLLVYNSASSGTCPWIDIIEIPLDDPAAARLIDIVPAGRSCHDTGVILGDVMLAACAGGNGFTVWSIGGPGGGTLTAPEMLYSRSVPGVSIGHSAAFSWDGRMLIFGHEPGGGSQARCQATSAEVDKTLFFFEARSGDELGRWVLPRPQTSTENCTIHNFNVVPTDRAHVLVAGNYQAGISVVDFTDPANAEEIAYADPAPLVPTQLGGDWSSYWYNGRIYESDIRRGLLVWNLSGSAVADARKFGHLNPQTQETSFELRRPTGSFTLLGHEPLLDRGMNAALAVHGDYAYIGSRTDGKDNNANNAGVMVVDVSDPTAPFVAHQIGPPWEGNPRESSRELRVWQSQDILIVLHTNCGGASAHGCQTPSINNFRFYDISGDNAADPQLILQFNRNTHEFFLWEDPFDPERALMFGGSAGSQWQIWDISPVREGQEPATLFSGSHGYSGGIHSLSVTNDGTRAHFALLSGGYAIADVSDFTAGVENPQYRQITPSANRPTWPGPGAHSAVKLWDRDWAYVSDEVYGSATGSSHGCPWGWARIIDIADPTQPTVEAEYRTRQNLPWLCDQHEPRPRTSYSAHNPTLTPNIAFSTWHSNGLQAINLENPRDPYQLAEFMPDPLPEVGMEDPRLSSDPDTGMGEKVVMWSFPIVKDGLVYVVDLRNGLYILEYEGHLAGEVNEVTFVEGNSNLGHALCFEHVLKPKEHPDDPDEHLVPEYC